MPSGNNKALAKHVENFCSENGFSFTEPRRYVLDIIALSKEPVGAYEILERLGKKLNDPKPPTVYRAIDFLSKHGFIHRIESLNAYVTCNAGHLHSGSQFMICKNCGTVEEVHLCSLPDSLKKAAKAKNFDIHHWNLELHGNCSKCSTKR